MEEQKDFNVFQFKEYSSIENTYRQKELDRIVEQGKSGGLWRVSEKVHGCLTWDTIVETEEHGNLPIGKIIDAKMECRVKCFNVDTGETEFKRVLNFSVKEDNSDWYELETADGKTLRITGAHYVWLPEMHCWRMVKDLKEGDKVLLD